MNESLSIDEIIRQAEEIRKKDGKTGAIGFGRCKYICK